jgi:hypothetical protein
MKRDSSSDRREPSDVPLIPPVAAILAVGMILPEYWLILVACALLAMTTLAVVQKVTGHGLKKRKNRTLIPADLH